MTPGRGCYRYALDGKLQAIDEPFEIARDGDGFVLTGQRNVGGKVMLEVSARYDAGTCRELDIAWNLETRRTAHYHHEGAVLAWREDGATSGRKALPDGCLMFPLLRAATGFLFPLLLDKPRNVVVPNIRNPNADDFLSPLLSQRHVRQHDPGDATHYRYYGGEYGDAGADYWVGEDGLVTRYRWESPQGTWDVTLAK